MSDASGPTPDDLLTDSYRRLVPGDGNLELGLVLDVLEAKGAMTEVGLEVFAPALTSLLAMEVGRRVRRSLLAITRRAP